MKPTIEEVKLAYKKIGLRPSFEEWIDLDAGLCCALSAVVIARGVKTPKTFSDLEVSSTGDLDLDRHMNSEVAGLLGVNYDFVSGFITGFDDAKTEFLIAVVYGSQTKEFLEARRLGTQTREALK